METLTLSIDLIDVIELRWRMIHLHRLLLAESMQTKSENNPLQGDVILVLNELQKAFPQVTVIEMAGFVLTRDVMIRGSLEGTYDNVVSLRNPGIKGVRMIGTWINESATEENVVA